jgi:protein involved in polysaccharide export with SLBB domain
MEAAANYTQQTYRIAPGDFLSIRHTFQPEMNQELVRPEGKVSALLVEDVSVSGMTTTTLSKSLADQTSHGLGNSQVIVELLSVSSSQTMQGPKLSC